MATKVEICNMALSHLGHGKEITSIDEKSNEALACKAYYDTALAEALRDFSWPFSTRYATLELITEDPNEEWAYAYKYPIKCVKILRIVSGTVNETESTRINYKVTGSDTGAVILSNEPELQVEYVHKDDNPAIYPPDFTIAFSYRLSVLIAPRVVGQDFRGIQKQNFELYRYELMKAAATAANEAQMDPLPDAEMIRVRNS